MKLLQLFPKADYTIVGMRIEVEKFALLPTRLTDGTVVWLEKVLYLLEGEETFVNLGLGKIYYWNIKRKLRCNYEQTNTTPSISDAEKASKEVCMVSTCAGKQETSFPSPFCSGRDCNIRCYLQNTCVEVYKKKG